MLCLTQWCSRFDPDILVGFDLLRTSWSYLVRRAAVIRFPLAKLVCRLKGKTFRFLLGFCQLWWILAFSSDPPLSNTFGTSPLAAVDSGRISLEVWRTIRKENPLRCYERSYVVAHLLRRTTPELKPHDLQRLLKSDNSEERFVSVMIRWFSFWKRKF